MEYLQELFLFNLQVSLNIFVCQTNSQVLMSTQQSHLQLLRDSEGEIVASAKF